VDAQGPRRAGDRERRPVADIAVPERAGALGLPAQPDAVPGRGRRRAAFEAVGAIPIPINPRFLKSGNTGGFVECGRRGAKIPRQSPCPRQSPPGTTEGGSGGFSGDNARVTP
jgi:hypothetical protein